MCCMQLNLPVLQLTLATLTNLPNFNPIKLAFLTIKQWLWLNHDHVNQELKSSEGMIYDIFWEAIHSVTMNQARGWYKHCGYIVNK